MLKRNHIHLDSNNKTPTNPKLEIAQISVENKMGKTIIE